MTPRQEDQIAAAAIALFWAAAMATVATLMWIVDRRERSRARSRARRTLTPPAARGKMALPTNRRLNP